MNYGKSAYLKVIELEKKINSDKQDLYSNGYLEFDKPNLNETLSSNKLTENFPSISLISGQDICFQIQVNVSSVSADTLKAKLYLDDTEIYDESFQLSIGANDFMIIKTFTPIATKEQKVSIVFENGTEGNTVKILSIKLVILGLSSLSEESALEMNALVFGDSVIVSYIDSDLLYYQICKSEPQSISKDKFIKYSKAVSHCFMKKNTNSNSKENLYLLIVDTDKNLKLVSPFANEDSILLDTNVSFVYGCLLENHEDQNLITYIKNGEVYYSTITDGKIIKGRKISLSESNYKEVYIATNNDSEYVYLIVTNENNSSYILRSLLETASGKFTETLSASYMVKISKYVDMELCDRKSVEHLSLLANFLTNPYVLFDSFINKKSISTLKCSYSYSTDEYFYEDPFLYGVKLDKNNPDPATWATYTDDAVGFEPAYMDFENNVFVDNGWESRWPFKRLKPCLYEMYGKKVSKYLNKNDYSKDTKGYSVVINRPSSKYVCIEIPRMYYRISSDDNYNYIQISNKEREGFSAYAFDCNEIKHDYIYVSAYLGTFDKVTIQQYISHSGMEYKLKENLKWSNISARITNFTRNTAFGLPFQVYTLLCCLFIIMFRSTDIRTCLGPGVTKKQEHYYSGEFDQKGMYYCSKESGRIKVFGIEDLYGLTRIATGGFEITSDNKWKWHDPSTPGSYSGLSSARKLYSEITGDNIVLPHLKSEQKYYTISLNGDTRLGFMGVNTETNTDSTKGFCETSCAYVPSHCIAVGNEEGVGGGLFACEAVSENEELNLSTRICFYNKLKS